MKGFFPKLKNILLDILFPAFCLNCKKEGSYLCQDCFSLIPLLEKPQELNNLTVFCASPYQNFIVKKLISQFETPPGLKELSKPISALILAHLASLKEPPSFKNSKLLPLKLKEAKRIGYNPTEEIAKELSPFLKEGEKNIVLVDLILDREKLEKKAKELIKKGAEEVSALVVAGL